jgi:type I restriction enzyme S subunit
MATNQGFKSFIPEPGVLDSKFLYHWLRSNRSYLESLGNGATFKEVSKAVVARVEIPLPPLPEQRRIAEILDRAEELRAKRRAALAQLDTLTQSIFLDMFGDPATNPKEWPDSTPLGDVADIVSGVTIGRNLNGKNTRTVPYLAVLNVQDRRLDLSVVKSTEATDDEVCRYRLERDDLLLTEGGDPDKLGRGSLWSEELPECIHQNHVFRVRLRSTNVTPLFVNWLVGSQRGKRYFMRSAKQTTGIASINMTQLRAFPILVPPLSLQHAFAVRVSAMDELRSTHRIALAELDALFASIQHRAFRGEL